MPGIFRDGDKKLKVADFSYAPNDSLAQMIVDAWVDDNFRNLLLNGGSKDRKNNAKALFASRGFFWRKTRMTPIVISETEYNQGWVLSDEKELCFVLPDHEGTCPPGQNLLDTARLLMAATPNGI
jgi:hypothetical protein